VITGLAAVPPTRTATLPSMQTCELMALKLSLDCTPIASYTVSENPGREGVVVPVLN